MEHSPLASASIIYTFLGSASSLLIEPSRDWNQSSTRSKWHLPQHPSYFPSKLLTHLFHPSSNHLHHFHATHLLSLFQQCIMRALANSNTAQAITYKGSREKVKGMRVSHQVNSIWRAAHSSPLGPQSEVSMIVDNPGMETYILGCKLRRHA